MNKLKNVWVIAEGSAECKTLCSAANALGEEVTLIYIGDAAEAAGAQKAYVSDESAVNTAPAAAALIKQAKPDLVLTSVTKNGRLAAGLAAAAVEADVLTDLSELCIDDGVSGTRMVYGGAGIKVEKALSGTAVACIGEGLFPEIELAPVTAEKLNVEAGIKRTGFKAKEVSKTNLASAKRVVGAGRGAAGSMELLAELAAAIGGEVGCTRPIAEEEQLMPRETYIGVSGLMLKPDIYIGVGASGQVQHMVGVNQARTIFAINKDKSAPIFSQCDCGIIGDAASVMQALIEKLK